MSTRATPVIITRHYDATAGRVFDAFLNPQVAQHFLFATATGEMIVADINPKIGGRYTFTERRPDMGEVRRVGEYREIDRPRRLVFTFGVPQFDPGMTTVSIEIRPEGNGCQLTLTNEGVPLDYAERNREGWSRILASLLPAYNGEHGAGWRSSPS